VSRDQRLLDAIVDLTTQRDQEALADTLALTLTEIAGYNTVCVYALQGELGQLSAKVMASTDPQFPKGAHIVPLERQPELRACVEGRRPIITQDGQQRREVYPVLEQGLVTALVTAQSNHSPDDTEPLAPGLVNIYANHQSLLNHQQRDALTGLFNRAALQSWLSKTLSPHHAPTRRSADESALGCLALLDIDHFKRINDTLGHLYGDEVLLVMADLMRESFRGNDLLFRYGGEEFIAILRDTDLDTAYVVLERFRTRIAQHKFANLNQVTVSIGLTQVLPQLTDSQLIERADKALYHGKAQGRDQVNTFEWLAEDHILPDEGLQPHTIELF
jgi:diguanylate cyclase (GGDEF)-like protein